MAKLAELQTKKWQSKLQHTKRQVLAILSRIVSFPKKQGSKGKGPSCSEATLDVVVVVHQTSSSIMEDVEEVIGVKQESPSCIEITLAVELPEDLLVEILHRLPVKSLVRFKSVSKEWKSLMEFGYLAEKHLNFIKRKNGFEEMKIAVEWSTSRSLCIKFFSKRNCMMRYSKTNATPCPLPGSCNGLVCCYEFVSDFGYIYLFNPMTGVSRKLISPLRGTILSVGFGIDVVTGSYKVVVLYSFERVVMVFDLKTSKWRHGDSIPLSCIPRRKRNPIFVNGSIFWLLESNSSEILAMNLHTEKFSIVSLPNEMYMSSDNIYMCSFEDRLCVSSSRQDLRVYVWVLLQDELNEKWERTEKELLDMFPPLLVNSSWFSQTLVSPYQSSSSTCIRSTQKQTRTSALFSGNGDLTNDIEAPIELQMFPFP